MKLKWDKNSNYRFLRNIPVSWIHQAINSHDRTELLFRIGIETIGFTIIFFITNSFSNTKIFPLAVSMISIHTIFWVFNDGLFVVMIVSFSFLTNGGLQKNLFFLKYIKEIFKRADCAEAILIYGSMSRNQFHSRSDIDLRILRKTEILPSLKCMILAVWLRTLAAIKLIPLDLLIVDSMEFLNRQMREDEQPIIVLKADKYSNPKLKSSRNFSDLLKNPEILLRNSS